MLTLTCLMASCGSSEPDAPTARGAVQFDNEALSRATLTTSGNLTDRPFAVYAGLQSLNNLSDEYNGVTICDGTVVSYDASAKEWTYDDPRYWFPQAQYSFVAIHPANSRYVKNPKFYKDNFSFTYSQPSDYSADDLLMAAHRRNYLDGPTYPVRFRFEHLLSNLDVAVTHKGDIPDTGPIRITGITFMDIPTIADYVVTPATLSDNAQMTSDYTYDDSSYFGWDIRSTSDFRITFKDSDQTAIIPNDNVAHSLFSGSNSLLVIPNPAEETEMEISYVVYGSDGNPGPTTTETAIIPTAWEPGRRYLLSVIIVNGIVKFSVDVKDWEETDPIATPVPRK